MNHLRICRVGSTIFDQQVILPDLAFYLSDLSCLLTVVMNYLCKSF